MNTEWEKRLRHTIDVLKETRATAECNANNMYWTNIKMHNNPKQFSPSEIEKGKELEKELGNLVANYDRMISILSEAVASATKPDLEGDGEAKQKEPLHQKLLECLSSGKQALERQKVIEAQMRDLEASLEQIKGRGVRLWVLNSRAKI